MKSRSWNPYLAGALTGVLLILSVVVAGQYLGASTTFARGAAVVQDSVGVATDRIDYYTTGKGKYGPGSLPNWQFMFVIGIVVGSFAAARVSGTFQYVPVPPMWAERFGPDPVRRGLAQLAVSGFIALAFFFVVGLITARVVYARGGGGGAS